MVFQSSVLILSPTNLFKIFLRCIKFINGCTKQGPCLRNSIVTSPQSNSFLSRSTLLFPFSPHLIPISSSFNNYHSVSLEHFTEAQRKTSKVLHLSKVYQRKGWVNLWSFIFIAFTHFPFTLNLLFENCFAKSFMKSTFFFFFFSPKKVFIYRSVHGVLILHLFGSQLFFSFPFICFCLTGSVRSKTHSSASHKSPSRPYQQIIMLHKQEKALALLEHRLFYQTRCLHQLLLATSSLLPSSEEMGGGRNKRLEKQKVILPSKVC